MASEYESNGVYARFLLGVVNFTEKELEMVRMCLLKKVLLEKAKIDDW